MTCSMKRRMWLTGFLFAGVLLISVGLLPARAQSESDPKAKEILDAVSAKYRSYDYIKADFSYTYTSPYEDGSYTEKGSLFVEPGGDKYRVQIAGQEMISDGKTAWVFLPEVNEVQVSALSGDSEELNPAQLFTLHEKGFKYVLKGESRLDGKSVYLIDLVPLESSAYSKMELSVEKNGNLIHRLKVFDKNGNHYIYTINAVDFSPHVDGGFFVFDKNAHPGVEVVDLR